MKPILFAGIVFLFHCHILNSQNLISNPSFDEVQPYTHGDIVSLARKHFNDNVRFWNTPNKGNPDIIMKRYLKDPLYAKKIGPSKFRSGDSMIGIRVFGCHGTKHCREYIQTKTKSTLDPDQCYEYEFYVQSNFNSIRTNGLGIGFTEYGINNRTEENFVDVEEMFIEEKLIDGGDGVWVKISGFFKPKKKYNYITIGNFYRDKNTKTKKIDDGSTHGYYYIDDIGLYKVDCVTGKRYSEQKVFVLNNINFETNSHQLDESNKHRLEEIYKQIESNAYNSITINGYTDNTGRDAHNLKLSQKRASSVLAALKTLGIPSSKLIAVGHGNSNPIDPLNKLKNRRVEIIID